MKNNLLILTLITAIIYSCSPEKGSDSSSSTITNSQYQELTKQIAELVTLYENFDIDNSAVKSYAGDAFWALDGLFEYDNNYSIIHHPIVELGTEPWQDNNYPAFVLGENGTALRITPKNNAPMIQENGRWSYVAKGCEIDIAFGKFEHLQPMTIHGRIVAMGGDYIVLDYYDSDNGYLRAIYKRYESLRALTHNLIDSAMASLLDNCANYDRTSAESLIQGEWSLHCTTQYLADGETLVDAIYAFGMHYGTGIGLNIYTFNADYTGSLLLQTADPEIDGSIIEFRWEYSADNSELMIMGTDSEIPLNQTIQLAGADQQFLVWDIEKDDKIVREVYLKVE